ADRRLDRPLARRAAGAVDLDGEGALAGARAVRGRLRGGVGVQRARDRHRAAERDRGGAGGGVGAGGAGRAPVRPGQRLALAAADALHAPSVDSRTTSEHGRVTTPVSSSPSIIRSRACEAMCPRRRYCMSTLVSWGVHCVARTSQLSWLTTATSSGTVTPARARASRAPRPI